MAELYQEIKSLLKGIGNLIIILDKNCKYYADNASLPVNQEETQACMEYISDNITDYEKIKNIYYFIKGEWSYFLSVSKFECRNENFVIIKCTWKDKIIETDLFNSIITFYNGYQGIIRQSIFSLCNTASVINNVLREHDCLKEVKYLNNQVKECYKMLKAITYMNEIRQYTYLLMDKKVINLTQTIDTFQKKFKKIIGNDSVDIKIDENVNYYINSDEERLRFLLLNCVNILFSNDKKFTKIFIHIYSVEENVYIIIKSEKDEDYDKYMFVKENEYKIGNNNNEDNMGKLLAKMYCDTFGGKVYFKDGKEKTIGLCLPLCEKAMDELSFSSSHSEYSLDRFSIYYQMTSEIVTPNFFDE